MLTPIDFYFDFMSPYGWFAARQIDAIGARFGRDVTWRPLLLGVTVLQVMGLKALPDTPLKSDYLELDVPRTARLFKLPYNPPTPLPANSLAPARAYYWLFDRDPAGAKRLARRLYDRQFAEATDVSVPDVVAETAAETLGLDPAAVLAAIADPQVKEQLRRAVDEAVARKAFGSPFFFVDDQPFWGSDRLWMVERWLETGGW